MNNEDRIWVHTITASRSGNHDDDKALLNPDAAYGWLLNKGVGIFQTDRPMLWISYLKSKNLHDELIFISIIQEKPR